MAKSTISRAYEILKDYKGKNNQIKYYKKLYEDGRLILEDFSSQYIVKNYDYEPIYVDKAVKISSDFGEVVREKFNLGYVPEKIYISTIIGEMGGSYHCYVKSKIAGSTLMYVKKRCILDKLVDIDYKSLDIDFDVFDNMPSNKGRKIKDHQKLGVKFLVANKKCILADDMGLGKMQDVDTLTPTPNGIVRFGDLSVGDKIFGSDGNPHNILAVYNHYKKDIYEIEFTDGSKTNSGLEHLWIVQDKNDIRRNKGWKVLSLQEILDKGLECSSGNCRAHDYNFRIPICQPVQYEEKDYFIHPYVLGMCIGYGNMRNGNIIISIPNTELESVDRIKGLLHDNYTLSENFSTSCPRYTIVKINSESRKNLYNEEINKLGLNVSSGLKFIPEIYKRGSIEQRKELLMGLMDSDGHITSSRNKISYITKSEKLANDIIELVQSLGGLATLHTHTRKNKCAEYLVSIQIRFCPFKLKNKSDRYTINDGHKKYLVKSIKSVKYLKTCDAMCIKVDSDDESYLTNNYIVTHNTTQSIIAALAGGYRNILIITTASLKTGWKKDLVLYEDESNINIVSGSEWTPGKKFTVINYDIIDNFYQVPMEPVYTYEDVTDSDGNVIETLKTPVMVKDKKTGKMVHKMQKSRKKADIQESLKHSPLFLEYYDCVIIDEAQKLSNKGSIRYTAIYDFLVKSSPKAIFLLTGTPLTNNPMNLYNILRLIDADITWDYNYYVTRYCGGVEHKKKDGSKFWTYSGATHLDELREKIKDIYIRRLASETGEMVNKEVTKRYYDLTVPQKIEYDKLWSDYQKALADDKREDSEHYRQLIEGGLVRQYLAKEMTEHTIELVDEMVEYGEKVVVITCFQEEMDIIKKHYGKKCVCYNGSMTPKQKDKAQDEFNNNDNVKVFIGQIIATSVGLNIPVARKLVFNSYDWVAANNIQCESRIHRLTQTRDVECIYMLFTDSISQDMFDKVVYKEMLMKQTIKSENEKKEYAK